ncbi:uncharacterized protein LOC135503462 [Lineus longissimus]|uniref:uncharacterized protein LOC135503462 n=1 Tax=Lineus longissimus TaxID=88925 RepID=UPI002B4E856F
MPIEIRSAALSQAERTIKELREENSVLKRELNETQSLYKQLVMENDKETFHERRVMLIKSQLIQMERQVLLLTEGLGSRSTTLFEVENSLSYLADTCRTFIAQETHSPEIPIQRAQLIKMVESAESARIKLYKNLENNTAENLAKPLMMMETFLKPNQEKPVTMLDVCNGKTDHINLKQVGKLETKLVGVYKCLSAVQHSLSSVMSIKNGTVHLSNHLSPAAYERVNGQISKACSQLREVNMELLELSLLLPTAPWPALQKSRIKEITAENVLSKLPKFPRSKQSEARSLVESLLKAMNYTLYVSNLEGQVLKDEVKFHQTLYDLQIAYINDLFKVIQDGYATFQDNTQELLVDPLRAVMKEYCEMKETASEDSLRTFLTSFKQHADEIQTAIESLSIPKEEESEGVRALSTFGEAFLKRLEEEEGLCRERRDTAIGEVEMVKSQREAFIAELQAELVAKPEEEEPVQDPKAEYQKIIDEDTAEGVATNSPSIAQDTSPESNSNHDDDCSCGGKKVGPLARRSRQKVADLAKGSPKCCDDKTDEKTVKREKENIATLSGDKTTTPSRPTPSKMGLPKPVRRSGIPVDRTPSRTPVPKKTPASSMNRSRSGSLTRSKSGSRENLLSTPGTPSSPNSTRASLAAGNHKVVPGIPMRSLNLKRDG